MRISLKKMSLKRLQSLINEGSPETFAQVIETLGGDPRGGAQKLVKYCQAKLQEWQQERDRIGRMFSYERQVWAMGYKMVAGLDEVGRGPLAGPVVAAAVILPGEVCLPGLDEVKRLSAKRRQELAEQIRQVAVAVGVGMVHPEGIDEANVMMATYKAMVKAVGDLKVPPDYLLIDALHLPNVTQPQAPLVGGDAHSCSIAAASVIAKATRDEHMVEMDKLYPQYGFANHKGYGTLEHREALERYGPCPIHRKTYGSVRDVVILTPGALFADDWVGRRVSRTAVGQAGEAAAAQYLVGLGYRVLERNVRYRTGEIDLVAEEGGCLIFVEVKTRTGSGYGTPAEAVDARKQLQLVRLATIYLAGRGWENRACRFDVVSVLSGPDGTWRCELIRNAFQAS